MRDAFGGILNVFIIAVFLVIISGILGFIVNYNKAFRMKNTIISIVEQYDGAKGCFSDTASGETDCRKRIKKAAEKYGYEPAALNCSNKREYTYKNSDGLFCYALVDSENQGKHSICKIITQVDINIPIIENIMGLEIFQIHGDSRPLVKRT